MSDAPRAIRTRSRIRSGTAGSRARVATIRATMTAGFAMRSTPSRPVATAHQSAAASTVATTIIPATDGVTRR